MKMRIWIILIGAMALVLSGCNTLQPTAAPTCPAPVCAPTVDVSTTLQAVATEAVGTAMAQLTLAAPTETPLPPTDTPEPSPTSGPSETPAPTATVTREFIPWTQTPTATVPAMGCQVTSTGTDPGSIKVGQEFDAVWQVKNTGTETWYTADIDVRYVEGEKLQAAGDVYDLNSTVAPGAAYTVRVDMKAPDRDGSFSTTWAIIMADQRICTLPITVSVAK